MQMEKIRCGWASGDPLYIDYHDNEWGVPLYDDDRLFEFLILETFQAGLSWITILKKRENFRKALDGFNYEKISRYNEKKVSELLEDAGIIRNRLKIAATITNAIAFIEIRREFGSFSNYFWSFTGGKQLKNGFKSLQEMPSTSPLSDTISKDLKKRGFKFIGSTVVYAHMQATGMVNDHITGCFRYSEVGRGKVNPSNQEAING